MFQTSSHIRNASTAFGISYPFFDSVRALALRLPLHLDGCVGHPSRPMFETSEEDPVRRGPSKKLRWASVCLYTLLLVTPRTRNIMYRAAGEEGDTLRETIKTGFCSDGGQEARRAVGCHREGGCVADFPSFWTMQIVVCSEIKSETIYYYV